MRDGEQLDGTLVLANSPLARTARVRAHIRGNAITGAVLAGDGRHVARIYGQIDDGGLRGTYRDRTGETGAWSAALP